MTGRAPEVPAAARAATRFRLAVGLALGLAILGGIVATRLGWSGVLPWIEALLHRVHDAGAVGWIVFACLQAGVAMIGIIPASLLGITAGAVYGLWLGFTLSAVGTLCGGWLAFLLSRSLLRPWIARRLASVMDGRLADLDTAIARDGWRLVCLLRISPVMPFAITSYALGLTRIAGRDFVLGTLAALPALAGYVAAGSLAGGGVRLASGAAGAPGPLQWLLIGAGVLTTLVLVLRSGALLASCGLLPAGTARVVGWRPFQARKP